MEFVGLFDEQRKYFKRFLPSQPITGINVPVCVSYDVFPLYILIASGKVYDRQHFVEVMEINGSSEIGHYDLDSGVTQKKNPKYYKSV